MSWIIVLATNAIARRPLTNDAWLTDSLRHFVGLRILGGARLLARELWVIGAALPAGSRIFALIGLVAFLAAPQIADVIGTVPTIGILGLLGFYIVASLRADEQTMRHAEGRFVIPAPEGEHRWTAVTVAWMAAGSILLPILIIAEIAFYAVGQLDLETAEREKSE
jgi:hypothetical protein